MNDFESVLQNSDKEKLQTFYKNVKKMTNVKYNKKDYGANLINIMTLFDVVNNQKNENYSNIIDNLTFKEYKELFGDFRRTLMNSRSKQSKINNLLNLNKKTNALKHYYLQSIHNP